MTTTAAAAAAAASIRLDYSEQYVSNTRVNSTGSIEGSLTGNNAYRANLSYYYQSALPPLLFRTTRVYIARAMHNLDADAELFVEHELVPTMQQELAGDVGANPLPWSSSSSSASCGDDNSSPIVLFACFPLNTSSSSSSSSLFASLLLGDTRSAPAFESGLPSNSSSSSSNNNNNADELALQAQIESFISNARRNGESTSTGTGSYANQIFDTLALDDLAAQVLGNNGGSGSGGEAFSYRTSAAMSFENSCAAAAEDQRDQQKDRIVVVFNRRVAISESSREVLATLLSSSSSPPPPPRASYTRVRVFCENTRLVAADDAGRSGGKKKNDALTWAAPVIMGRDDHAPEEEEEEEEEEALEEEAATAIRPPRNRALAKEEQIRQWDDLLKDKIIDSYSFARTRLAAFFGIDGGSSSINSSSSNTNSSSSSSSSNSSSPLREGATGGSAADAADLATAMDELLNDVKSCDNRVSQTSYVLIGLVYFMMSVFALGVFYLLFVTNEASVFGDDAVSSNAVRITLLVWFSLCSLCFTLSGWRTQDPVSCAIGIFMGVFALVFFVLTCFDKNKGMQLILSLANIQTFFAKTHVRFAIPLVVILFILIDVSFANDSTGKLYIELLLFAVWIFCMLLLPRDHGTTAIKKLAAKNMSPTPSSSSVQPSAPSKDSMVSESVQQPSTATATPAAGSGEQEPELQSVVTRANQAITELEKQRKNHK